MSDILGYPFLWKILTSFNSYLSESETEPAASNDENSKSETNPIGWTGPAEDPETNPIGWTGPDEAPETNPIGWTGLRVAAITRSALVVGEELETAEGPCTSIHPATLTETQTGLEKRDILDVAPQKELKTAVVPQTELKSAVASLTELKSAVAPLTELKSAVAPQTELKSVVAPLTELETAVASPRREGDLFFTPSPSTTCALQHVNSRKRKLSESPQVEMIVIRYRTGTCR